jgi:hypothetical protein
VPTRERDRTGAVERMIELVGDVDRRDVEPGKRRQPGERLAAERDPAPAPLGEDDDRAEAVRSGCSASGAAHCLGVAVREPPRERRPSAQVSAERATGPEELWEQACKTRHGPQGRGVAQHYPAPARRSDCDLKAQHDARRLRG